MSKMVKMAASRSRDRRVGRMINNPDAYYKNARKAARKEAEAAFKREEELRRRK